jgi:hypothetical protein
LNWSITVHSRYQVLYLSFRLAIWTVYRQTNQKFYIPVFYTSVHNYPFY